MAENPGPTSPGSGTESGLGGKKKGAMSWVWGMTGGIISRMSGEKEGAESGSDKRKPQARKAFWNKRSQARLPGTVKQVRGAQYPPLTAKQSMPVLRQPENKQSLGAPRKSNSQQTLGGQKSTGLGNSVQKSVSPTQNTPGTTGHPDSGDGEEDVEKKERNEQTETRPGTDSANALSKRAQIFKLINEPTLDLGELRRRSWSGLCPAVRNDAWQLLLGYQPANRERRGPTVAKRRKEYQDHCNKHYSRDDSQYSASEKKIMHQIRLDTKRTLPGVKLIQHEAIQLILERILYIWSIRHPASGYVQGINDLVVPFLMVFLASKAGVVPQHLEEKHLKDENLQLVEPDAFWCLSKLLDGIQDHYTSAQPGIQRMVFKLEELIHRLDQPLHAHLKKHNIRFFHFSYRWMNCLLMREVSLPLIIRVWDTYIAEPDGFKVFHIYVCAAMLIRFSPDLRKLDEFQDLIVYLQNLPTKDWTEVDVETVLAQAYVYKYQFEGAENHLH
eukprot:CAMPEP_0114507096 /NCGR_PEP_ID=MMETSP0109-20121206/11819_1 /TAXON_ID=29199 /ORGANISM="Chlorarachnion reptans, Strain CCCM449" /LENGTH=499 /DNA_ID=CAMNT_0001685809 /DNA_START=62 /DNA_END=1561 /DNA_ORIENTATION=+